MMKVILGYRGQGKDLNLTYKMLYRICINTYGIGFIFLKRTAKLELIKDAYEFVLEMSSTFKDQNVFEDEDNA